MGDHTARPKHRGCARVCASDREGNTGEREARRPSLSRASLRGCRRGYGARASGAVSSAPAGCGRDGPSCPSNGSWARGRRPWCRDTPRVLSPSLRVSQGPGNIQKRTNYDQRVFQQTFVFPPAAAGARPAAVSRCAGAVRRVLAYVRISGYGFCTLDQWGHLNRELRL